jgi:hypothetical protein
MSGVFASWQPRYAEHGIPTFPVDFVDGRKKPSTTAYDKVGINGSRELALKFADNDALGFMLGRRSRITVLDIDTTCERTRDEVLSHHGEPAILVRSGRGHWQAWYRYNGETRRIRPWGAERPVDLLGSGVAVAPPSKAPHGTYAFIRGGLDALAQLEPLRNIDRPTLRRSTAPVESLVREGQRHKTLLRYCQKQARHCDDLEQLIDVARTHAQNNLDMTGMTHAYTDTQIMEAASWAWALEVKGLNLVGRGGAIVIRHDVVDSIAASDADAFALWSILWRHHSDRREFIIANAMADSLGWTLPRFKTARARLCVPHRLIECVHLGGRGAGDPPRYRWKGYDSISQS